MRTMKERIKVAEMIATSEDTSSLQALKSRKLIMTEN